VTATLRDVRDGFADYEAWARDPTPRIGFGLPFFDGPTRGGIAKAECAMILAYSSVGKTSIALNVIVNNPHIPTVFFSIEMSWRLVVARLAAINTGTPTWELEAALKGGQYPGQLMDTATAYPFLLGNDQSEISIKEMKQYVTDAGRKFGTPVRLVVIDYLELIGGAGMLGKSEQVDKAAQKIRSLAKDCDCAVLVLHQVGKGDGSDGHKSLSLDSGKYGGHHPMDYVIGAYAPRLNRELDERGLAAVEDELYLQLLKNRSGKANPAGVRHHLHTASNRLTLWGATHVGPPLASRGYPASLLDTPPAPSIYAYPKDEPF
jgi:replicative DNA helicase